MVTNLLTYAVEDNHNVVNCITDDSKQSRNEVLIHLHGERHYLPEQDIDSDNHQRRRRDGGKRTNREGNITETNEDIYRHEEQREPNSDKCLTSDVA